MEEIVVGCVQLKIRLPQDREELEQHLLRFVRLAQTKRVRLLVFPQFTGLMAAALVAKGGRAGLLKQADRARRANASFWTRTQAKLAGGAAGMLGADFSAAIEGLLLRQPEAVWESYTSLFSAIARYHGMTVVAGSSFLEDPTDGIVRHLALVFGPDGQLLGQQAAVTLPGDEHPLVEAGQSWQAISTPVGRLGLLIGSDALFPEAGRLLAFAGAEALIGLGAVAKPVHVHRLRQGVLARVEDNQLYGMASFAVGYNPFTPADETPYIGRSLIAAPAAMTPRANSILVEMGADSPEGLITAEWSYAALREQWAADDLAVRSGLPADRVGAPLAAVYSRQVPFDQAHQLPVPPRPEVSSDTIGGFLLTESDQNNEL
jgi:predicted amidohydrolase